MTMSTATLMIMSVLEMMEMPWETSKSSEEVYPPSRTAWKTNCKQLPATNFAASTLRALKMKL